MRQGKKSNVFQKGPSLEQWVRAGGLGDGGSVEKCISHQHGDNCDPDPQDPHKAYNASLLWKEMELQGKAGYEARSGRPSCY